MILEVCVWGGSEHSHPGLQSKSKATLGSYKTPSKDKNQTNTNRTLQPAHSNLRATDLGFDFFRQLVCIARAGLELRILLPQPPKSVLVFPQCLVGFTSEVPKGGTVMSLSLLRVIS